MNPKIYSVAFGPLKDGKPDSVQIIVAYSFAQLCEYLSESDVFSIQVLPDNPVIL